MSFLWSAELYFLMTLGDSHSNTNDLDLELTIDLRFQVNIHIVNVDFIISSIARIVKSKFKL